MYDQNVEFFCIKRNSPVVMPISECYKIKQKKRNSTVYRVKAIDLQGNYLNKNICKSEYDDLSCRIVEY